MGPPTAPAQAYTAVVELRNRLQVALDIRLRAGSSERSGFALATSPSQHFCVSTTRSMRRPASMFVADTRLCLTAFALKPVHRSRCVSSTRRRGVGVGALMLAAIPTLRTGRDERAHSRSITPGPLRRHALLFCANLVPTSSRWAATTSIIGDTMVVCTPGRRCAPWAARPSVLPGGPRAPPAAHLLSGPAEAAHKQGPQKGQPGQGPPRSPPARTLSLERPSRAPPPSVGADRAPSVGNGRASARQRDAQPATCPRQPRGTRAVG